MPQKDPTPHATWLESLPWSHWFTLTFKYPPSPQAAMQCWGRYTIKGRSDPGFAWFVAAENGRGGRAHLHGLGLFRHPGDAMFLNQFWRGAYGFSQVRPFTDRRGAGAYVAKYVTKEDAIWDIGGRLPLAANLDRSGRFRCLPALHSGSSKAYTHGHREREERHQSFSLRSEALQNSWKCKKDGMLEIEEVSPSGQLTRRQVNMFRMRTVTCGPSTSEIHASGL